MDFEPAYQSEVHHQLYRIHAPQALPNFLNCLGFQSHIFDHPFNKSIATQDFEIYMKNNSIKNTLNIDISQSTMISDDLFLSTSLTNIFNKVA